MLVSLQLVDGHVELVAPEPVGLLHRLLEPADVAALAGFGQRYRKLVRQSNETVEAGLLGLGRELHGWLDGQGGWLGRLRAVLVPPLVLEVRGQWETGDEDWVLLNAPWELLADERGFWAEDAQLGFAPLRRLGEPAATAAAPDLHRLGVAFMASAPRGQVELDFEAEERAVLEAIDPKLGIDLLVEDSGDPEQLKLRLNELGALPVLHLSCHGHDAWRPAGQSEATPQPVLLMEDAQGRARPTPAAQLLAELDPYKLSVPELIAARSGLASLGLNERDHGCKDAGHEGYATIQPEELVSRHRYHVARLMPSATQGRCCDSERSRYSARARPSAAARRSCQRSRSRVC